MSNSIKISIIIPVYNAEKHLRQCLDSLLNQNIPMEQYEIIGISDGSRDGSLAILQEYAEKYPNVIAVGKENEGVSATRNKGMDLARGEYVWFIDADDWIARDFLGNSGILELLDSQRAPLILTGCVDMPDSESEKYADLHVSAGEVRFEKSSPFMTTSRGHFFAKHLIDAYQLRYDTNLAYGEDLMFMREYLDFIRLENEKGSDYTILQGKGKDIYLYRIHSESVMGKLSSRMEKVADSILYRARISMERHKNEAMPEWYRLNYQEYVHLHMKEYMIYYFPGLSAPMAAHLKQLKKEGLYPAPPPKLGWVKQTNPIAKIQQFAFKHRLVYPLYYMIMRLKFKKAGSI